MLNEEIKNKIKILFSEKKYEEVIETSERFSSPEDRPAGLINIIGISYFLKENRNENDIKTALSFFELTYLKDKNTIHGLNGLKNLILMGIKASIEFKNLSKFLIKAKNHFNDAIKYFENNEEFLNAGLALSLHLLDIKMQKNIIHKVLDSKNSSKSLRGQSLFMKNYYFDNSQKDYLVYAKNNSKYYSKLQVKNVNEIQNLKNDKINLGFVSCDILRNHSTTFFLKDTIRYLDKSKFKIFIFSIAKKDYDDASQNELRNIADEWFDLKNSNNQEVVELIQKKKINILFDLMGYTASERLEIFNSRVALIQISWLAYLNTTGLDTIDYLLVDNNLIKSNENNLYAEKILKLPDIWNAHAGFKYERKYNELPFLKNKNFTFGSLNNFRKISDETLYVWSEILKKVPNSNLILKSADFCSDEILMNKFKIEGVDNRVKILNKIDFIKKEDHLNVYQKIDLCLDTFPHNGVTTTFEALWMGVPVIVLKGKNFCSRCGESIIKNTKIDGLIADDLNDYISKAIHLSKDIKILTQIRENLYQSVLSSPLFDTKTFSKNFNNTLLQIYKETN